MRKNFVDTPSVRYRRSKFDLSKKVITSMQVGRLTPIDIIEVLPGDTFKTTLTNVSRISSAFLKPVMDNCYMDIYHFFVPYRLLYDDAEKVFGNPNPTSYTSNSLSSFPSFGNSQSVGSRTVGDYLGLPIGIVPGDISVLPFRAFAKIYNDWFRNENVDDEVYIQTGEKAVSENLNVNEWSASNYTGKLPYVGKRKDYFTSALPQPQKGLPIELPIATGQATVKQSDVFKGYYTGYNPLALQVGNVEKPVYLANDGILSSNATQSVMVVNNYPGSTSNVSGEPISLYPGALYADMSTANAININDFMFLLQQQRVLERSARFGDRYNEYLLGAFGVHSPDARLQFSEFLGGGRIPINIQTVAQTSAGTEDNPLGDLGAYSLSGGKSRYTKGFVEHGYVMTVACIRTMHTYQQGINKMWSRLKKEDFYDTLYASLGEQPIYTSEIYALNQDNFKSNIFGFNEAWADYRYSPNRVSGQMRSNVAYSQDIWHFADVYDTSPVLGSQFNKETDLFFNRTVAVDNSDYDQFLCDFWFDTKAIRVMPMYSVPSIIPQH